MEMTSMNRTESTMAISLEDNREWCVCDDHRREFRIGITVNCNDELPMNDSARTETCANMARFLERIGILSYEIHTISNSHEYSSCLRITEPEYVKMKTIVRDFHEKFD